MSLLLILLSIPICKASTLNEAIYTPVDFGNKLCFRMNNYNSQTGCQTGRDGDTGVLYPFSTEESIRSFIETFDQPLVAVVNSSLFYNATADLFLKYSDMKGIIIVEDEPLNQGFSFSPEKSCPGNGFNVGETAGLISERHCQSAKLWNPAGNWLSYYDFPFGIFIIQDPEEKIKVLQKAQENMLSGSVKPYPLWGAELRSFMNSALDTETCIRRGTCDPLGSYNTIVSFRPVQQTKRPVILFVTKADATAFFKELSFGAKASGGGIVVLLGLIKALALTRDNDSTNDFANSLNADFMVSFLLGESFDYSGSQRLAYDMKEGLFGKEPRTIFLSDIHCVIEIGPVTTSNELYLHSHKQDETVKQVQETFSKYSGDGKTFVFTDSPTLPPSSLHSFLREDDSVSGVLISDGEEFLLSGVYGSRYDVLKTTPALAGKLRDLIKITADVALQLAGGQESAQTELDITFVSDLMDCILVNQNCSLLQDILNITNIHDNRLSRYIGVATYSQNFTTYLWYMSREFSKKDLGLPEASCNSSIAEGWMVVYDNGTCYGFMANRTEAQSPAFLLGDYTSTKYSTWTESRWSPKFQLRLFMIASVSENRTVFCLGLLYYTIVTLIVLQCHRRSNRIYALVSSDISI